MEFLLVKGRQDIEPYMGELLQAPVIAVDTETTGLDPHADKPRLIQLAAEGMPVLVVDCFTFLPEGTPLLKDIFSSRAVKVFQNAKFDLQFLLALGIQPPAAIFDTMLAAQLLQGSGGPQGFGLAELVRHYLGESVAKQEQTSDWTGTLTAEQLEYAARDAEVLLRLRKAMITEIRKNDLVEVARQEFSCARAIAEVEFSGIHLNLDRWDALRQQVEAEQRSCQEKLSAYIGSARVQLRFFEEDPLSGVNLDSNKQILIILNSHDIPVTTTSRHALAPYLDNPLVQALSEYRRTSKLLSSFLNSLPQQIHPVTGRLHPRYAQIGAWSGRMSCGGPNIQQIPRDKQFRACFTAPAGSKLVIADYSQIELRVVAEISKDRRMIEAYRNGEDLHRLTASLLTGKRIEEVLKAERQSAKAVNFGLVFAMGARGLQGYASETYGVDMSLEQAEQFRNRFFQAYQGVAAWHKQLQDHPPRESRTLAGRKFVFGGNSGLAGCATPRFKAARRILSRTPLACWSTSWPAPAPKSWRWSMTKLCWKPDRKMPLRLPPS